MNPETPNGKALIPILIFLLLYLGTGVYFEYIHPTPGEMGFYVMSVVLAFSIALLAAFYINPRLPLNEKFRVCSRGIGDENITIMLFIFLLAGAFSGVAREAGGAVSAAHMLLNWIPGNMALPGLFIIACIISMAMGTSVGTITVLVPIAVTVAQQGGFAMPLIIGSVVSGAMFGDNLSFISDTTIAATRTQGVRMKDKFNANIRIALPAAIMTLIFLVVEAGGTSVSMQTHYDYNIWQALPYFIVLAMSLMGINVFIVLLDGILLFIAAGLGTGTLTIPTALKVMGNGMAGMYETIIVTILVASIGALVKQAGGFAAILHFIRSSYHGHRGGMIGICLLTSIMDIATANNTVAIVMAGPLARQIGEEYGIQPKKVASLLDTCSCIWQGIIPYGAQLLIAGGLAVIPSISIIPYLYYQFFLIFCVGASIVLDKNK
jgi:Na+/H+ antiporter NhaC